MSKDYAATGVPAAMPRKQWSRPTLRIVNIKELTQSGGVRLGDNAGGQTKRS